MTVAAVAADVACLLRNFALQESFSADTGGGGRASNARLIMPLLQLGRHLMSTADAATVAQLANAGAELGADIPVRLTRVRYTSTSGFEVNRGIPRDSMRITAQQCCHIIAV